MASSVANMYLGKSTEYFALFGAVAASYIAFKICSSVFTGIRTFFLSSPINFKKLGTWAVVTGSTDGIGKAYAQQLAKLGMDIVLISRSPDKLADVALEIESKFKVKTKTLPIDFSAEGGIYEKISKELVNLDIGVLVNNVGMGYPWPEFFLDLDDKLIKNLISVNVTSAVMMTKIVLPSMVEKRKGAILNISSASAVQPSPLLTVYSASKVFVDYFSRALQTEYASKGVIIQSVTPFFVATKLSKIRNHTFFTPAPGPYVQSALATVGKETETFGCVSHALQGYIVSRIPNWLYNKIGNGAMLAARKRALKKVAAAKKD